jgi:RimJ/RimL family protein N-acetyltransferase
VVPIIETARLRLRAIRESDLEAWSVVTADPVVVRHLGGAAMSREDTWRRLLGTSGSWVMLGYGYWAVELKDGDGMMIGHCGFSDFKRDLLPSIDGLPEMGWVFARTAQGLGYGLEAVAAGLDWADAALPGVEIPAIISPDNVPSIRVAEKAGFRVAERTTYKNEPILLFRRPPRGCVLPAPAAPTAPAST